MILRVSQRATTEDFLKFLSGSCGSKEPRYNAGGTLGVECTVCILIVEEEKKRANSPIC
jgi:hypothetical protein